MRTAPGSILNPIAARQRWLSVGDSAVADSRQAGQDAAQRALGNRDACLLIVLCSALHDPAAVLAGINTVSGGVPLIGCSSGAEIASDGPRTGSVVVVALGGPGFSVATAAATGAASRQREVGAEVAESVTRIDNRSHQLLLMLTDGLSPSQDEILAGAYGVVGETMPVVGGAASPAADERPTFHLHGDEVLTGAVVAAAISSDGPFGIGLRHGWRVVGEPMIVTRSFGGDIYTLDGQPALHAYLKRLDAPAEAYTDPGAFHALARFWPLGVRYGNVIEPQGVDSTRHFQQGWLHSHGEVPEGDLVWLMERDQESLIRAADEACLDAVRELDGQPPLGLLAFDCELRALLLGDEGTRREVARMTTHVGQVPVAGLYTWGEIARLPVGTGYHNWMLVALAIG